MSCTLQQWSLELKENMLFRSTEMFLQDDSLWCTCTKLFSRSSLSPKQITETDRTQPVSSCFPKHLPHLDQIPNPYSRLCNWQCLAACPPGLVMKSNSHWGTDDSILQNSNIAQKILIYPVLGLLGTRQKGAERSS